MKRACCIVISSMYSPLQWSSTLQFSDKFFYMNFILSSTPSLPNGPLSLPSPCLNLYEPCVLYIGQAYHYPPNVAFYILSTEYFKHASHSPFFSSKCRLFHNATFFGSCIIHILHTGVLKF
jgi:hypothetical protein